MTDLQRARDFFQNDKYATKATGIVIDEVKENYARCSLKIGDDHKNALGNVMGGVCFTLADFVFAVATNFDKPFYTVTTVSQISFFTIAKGDTLIGESKMLKDGRKTCFYEVEITDNLGTLVAKATFNGCHLN